MYLEYYLIIQMNAAIESYWSIIKYKDLKWFNRSRLDYLCSIIHEQFLSHFVLTIDQIRNHLKSIEWYKSMISKWRKYLQIIRDEDLIDFMNEELEFAADDRLNRMSELHRIDLDSWTCIYIAFMIFLYYICKYLIHLFDNEYLNK